MKIREIAAAAVALSLAAAPTISVAQQVNANSLVRASATQTDANGQEDSNVSTYVIAALALGAIVGGIILATDNDSDTPTSP